MNINSVVSACGWEFKAGKIRNTVFIVIILFLTFLGTFNDFPYNEPEATPESNKLGKLFNFIVGQIIIFMVFRYAIFRELDDREFFNRTPIGYKSYFLGKCLFLLIVSIAGDVFAYSIYAAADVYYGNSLETYSASRFADKLPKHASDSLFSAVFIFFAALCRPFHYAVLIAVITGLYWLVDTKPAYAGYLPFFSSAYQADLAWTPLFLVAGMYGFEIRMRSQPSKISANRSFRKRFRWLIRFKIGRVMAVVVTLVCFGFGIYVSIPQESLPTAGQLEKRFFSSLTPLYNKNSLSTSSFTFSFEQQNRWIAESAEKYIDREWRRLQDEFGVSFDPADTLDVFIKPSDDHVLGSTRGAYIVINSNTVSVSENKQKTLRATIRHELTHVLINRLSDYRLVEKERILNSFLHEGLAQLAELEWRTDENRLNREAALHYRAYDLQLIELLPKMEHYGDYDYDLNYSFGYVFWSRFVHTFGRQKIKDFLVALAKKEPDDKDFEGTQFLFHKAALAGIDLYPILEDSKRQLLADSRDIDKSVLEQVMGLKKPKVLSVEKDSVLIPYRFDKSLRVRCFFRNKDSLQTRKQWLEPWPYQWQEGGICHAPKDSKEKLQLVVYFESGLTFMSSWVEIRNLVTDNDSDREKVRELLE